MIASVPVVWRILELPNLKQMAIPVGAVMAVPVLTGDVARNRAAVLRRAAQRVAGCGLGGGIGLLLLALPLADAFVPWLLLLMAGAAAGVQVQSGRHGISVAGAQATIAFILTLVQGAGPPASLVPTVDRLAGMLGALLLMLIATLLLGLSSAVELPRRTKAS